MNARKLSFYMSAVAAAALLGVSGAAAQTGAAITGTVTSAQEGAMEGVLVTAKKDGAKIDYTFNQGVMSMDCWAVPVGAPHAAEAMKMINEMSKPEAQATNKRAYETGLIPDDVSKKLPTYPDNAAHQLAQRNEWWVEHVGEAQLGFQEMMSR